MKNIKILDRDVSWMYFNHRILEESRKNTVPILERLSFLGIYSNNLDEFFRVRIANLNRIAVCKEKIAKKEVEHAKETLKTILKLNNEYSKEYQIAISEVTECLRKENIQIVSEKEITDSQRAYVISYYRKHLIGNLSPIWIDNIKHFDNEADDKIYFIIKATIKERKPLYAILPLPTELCGRWVQLPKENDINFIMYIDDVIRVCLPLVFPGLQFDTFEAYSFKFTRDAEMEIDNDLSNGFLQKISKGIKSRKQGVPLRLVYDNSMPEGMLRKIKQRLNGNGKLDTSMAAGKYQNHRDMMNFPNCNRDDLKYEKWPSILNQELHGTESIFDVIRKKDRFIHVPYHSFDGYIRLLNEAAINPQVKAIKTTLYRLAKDSKVIRALICAAQNGKKVTVVIELLARFDEASNIDWSKKMQDAGIEVIFGVEGLKIHSKITHISFYTGSSIACISTGNFHEGNAVVYTDVLLLTANQAITKDVDKVFKFIERPYAPINFKELLVSPNEMKKKIITLIDTEIKNHLSGKLSGIKLKINHITDIQIVEKIQKAAKVGVPIEMLVRGNCSLVDSVEFNNNLRVVGIIDRYLEHSRIFIFTNAGDEKVFIGSADMMPRNLDNRIEVITPIYDKTIQKECKRIVDFGLKDTKQGRVIIGNPDNSYGDSFRSQKELYNYYKNEKRKK